LTGRVTGVARFGLFMTVAETGADGLIPMSSLPDDFYRHDARRHRLVGRRTRRVFALGDTIAARLDEADPVSGRLVFRLEEAEPTPGPRETGARKTGGRKTRRGR
jgi:ribonuclease R